MVLRAPWTRKCCRAMSHPWSQNHQKDDSGIFRKGFTSQAPQKTRSRASLSVMWKGDCPPALAWEHGLLCKNIKSHGVGCLAFSQQGWIPVIWCAQPQEWKNAVLTTFRDAWKNVNWELGSMLPTLQEWYFSWELWQPTCAIFCTWSCPLLNLTQFFPTVAGPVGQAECSVCGDTPRDCGQFQ